MITKINLGCGPIGEDTWINIDWGILATAHKYPLIKRILVRCNLWPKGYSMKWPSNLRLHNCRKKMPFPSESVDYIYTSHFLEHFRKFEAETILAECYRIIKKMGIIRIVVPDLALLAQKYAEKDFGYFVKVNNLMNPEEKGIHDKKGILLGDVFMSSFYPAFCKEKFTGLNKLMSFFTKPHLWMYDQDSLKNLLSKAGFKNIEKRKYREGKVPDLVRLDTLPETSLYMEAEK